MEREPLLGRPAAQVVETPVERLAFFWPCLTAGVLLSSVALLSSVGLTKAILDDPPRADYFQTNWWLVWLAAVLLFFALLPVFLFTTVVMTLTRTVTGPRGAFPSWGALVLLSNTTGCVFYGLFNATYPFSFFLQVQVYSAVAALSLCAYVTFAFATQCVPGCGFSQLGAWLFCTSGSVVAYVHMGAAFAYLGYSESRTPGDGLWHPWVALLLQLLFLNLGAIQNASSMAGAARQFEPGSVY